MPVTVRGFSARSGSENESECSHVCRRFLPPLQLHLINFIEAATHVEHLDRRCRISLLLGCGGSGAVTTVTSARTPSVSPRRRVNELELVRSCDSLPLPHGLCTVRRCAANLLSSLRSNGRHYRHSAVAIQRHRGTARGFLPRGLSNTCPQVGAMRCIVVSHRQVSNKTIETAVMFLKS